MEESWMNRVLFYLLYNRIVYYLKGAMDENEVE